MHRWWLLALMACRNDAAPPADSAPPADGFPTECTGDCAETAVRAEFRLVRTFDRAVYGNNADGTLHVEAYLGDGDGCPSETTPTPDYTLVVAKVAPPNGPALTLAMGNVLDFVGDLLGGALGAQANTVIVRAVAAKTDEFVALDVDLDFTDGAIVGHLYAVHCPSLDTL